LITVIMVFGCANKTPIMSEKMNNDRTFQDVAPDFQGITIQGPAEATFVKEKVGRALWDHSNEEKNAYFGKLEVRGIVQIYTPKGKQFETWVNFNKRVEFIIKDLTTNTVQKSSYVEGGWNLGRKGLSLQMHNPDQPTEEEFNSKMSSDVYIKKNFIIAVDDRLPELYSEPTTLEIYAEYMDFTSNKILVKINIQ